MCCHHTVTQTICAETASQRRDIMCQSQFMNMALICSENRAWRLHVLLVLRILQKMQVVSCTMGSVKIGELALKVMHTLGHTRGSISLLMKKRAFFDDMFFEGSIGRTDFPEGSETGMMLSLRKLASLPDAFVVYLGHGSRTTIGREKGNNRSYSGNIHNTSLNRSSSFDMNNSLVRQFSQ